MSIDVFRQDIELAEHRLGVESRRRFWMKLLSLGLLDNRRRVASARERLQECRSQLVHYESLLMKAEELDDLLLQTIELEGVRLSRHVFADVTVLGQADYGEDWDQLRDLVLARDDHECQEADGHCKGPFQIHHVVALSKGGANDLDNLVTLCFYHHCLKHEHMRAKYRGSLWC